MKNLLIVGSIVFLIALSNSQAGYLSLDDEGDIIRVSNNIHYFCYNKKEVLDQIVSQKGKILQNQFEELMTSGMMKDYKKDPIKFKEDFNKVVSYINDDKNINNDKNVVSNYLGDLELKNVKAGLNWVKYLITQIKF